MNIFNIVDGKKSELVASLIISPEEQLRFFFDHCSEQTKVTLVTCPLMFVIRTTVDKSKLDLSLRLKITGDEVEIIMNYGIADPRSRILRPILLNWNEQHPGRKSLSLFKGIEKLYTTMKTPVHLRKEPTGLWREDINLYLKVFSKLYEGSEL